MKVKTLKTLFLVLLAFGFIFVNVSVAANGPELSEFEPEDQRALEVEEIDEVDIDSIDSKGDKGAWRIGKVILVRAYNCHSATGYFAYVYISSPLTTVPYKTYYFYTKNKECVAALVAAQGTNLSVNMYGSYTTPLSSGYCGLLLHYGVYSNL